MKKNLLKLIAIIMVVSMASVLFMACNDDKLPAGESSSGSESESESESETLPPAPKEDIKIIENGKSQYKIIRPEIAKDYEKNGATALMQALMDKTGVKLEMGDDWLNDKLGYTEGEYEILVGNTNREASREGYALIRTNDYAVTIVGKKIVVAAYTEEKMNEAVAYLVEKLTASDGNATFLADNVTINKAEYEVDSITFNGNELSAYKIVYKVGASDAVKNAVTAIADAMRDKYGYNLRTGLDSTEKEPYEIVIGDAARGNSENEQALLRSRDYKIYGQDDRIYIVAGSDETYAAAVESFLGMLESKKADNKIDIKNDLHIVYASNTYVTEKVTLNGVPIEEYVIVYNSDSGLSLKLASKLRTVIDQICGRRLDILSDSRPDSGKKEILIGYSDRLTGSASGVKTMVDGISMGKYILASSGNYLYAGGVEGDNLATMTALNELIKELNAISDPKSATLKLNVKDGKAEAGAAYSIISYNDGDNATTNLQQISAILKDYSADIFGLQEVQTPHAERYKTALGGVYEYVLYDNDGTTFNSQPIFWKKDKFELLDSGIMWLSDTPEKRSKFAESDYYRSFTYAVLKDKETGLEMVIVNTHIDYIQAVNAKQTAKLMELTEQFRDRPVLFLGDFNMQRNSDGYRNIYNAGYTDTGSYLGDKTAVIDFCFIDVSNTVATDYKIVDDHEYSKTASDHYPIYSEFIAIG